jgi:DNA-binding transcriptional MerR regulator
MISSKYTISDLEQISGIKAHTIRIWEKRYKALRPMRSAGNTRYYDERQLQKLLNVVSISETGKKISELFSLPEAELNRLLEEEITNSHSSDTQFEYFISQMLVSGLSYNEPAFEKNFSACLLRYGMNNTYQNIIYPMLVRIGLIWGKDELCPAQEHFISNLVRQKILAAIDGLPLITASKQNWLLYLPEGEDHEIGLMFSSYMIRSTQKRTIYLGAHVPLTSLKEAINENQPTHILFFMVKNHPLNETQEYLKKVRSLSKEAILHMAGNKKIMSKLKLDKKMHVIQSIEQFKDLLKSE